jgi:hypothetical protein
METREKKKKLLLFTWPESGARRNGRENSSAVALTGWKKLRHMGLRDEGILVAGILRKCRKKKQKLGIQSLKEECSIRGLLSIFVGRSQAYDQQSLFEFFWEKMPEDTCCTQPKRNPHSSLLRVKWRDGEEKKITINTKINGKKGGIE